MIDGDYSDIRALPTSETTRLVIDAGGSTLRMVECDMNGRRLELEKYLQPEQVFASMDEGIASFLRTIGHRPEIGVIGAAGPIEHGKSVKLTNIPEWPVFDLERACRNFGVRLYLFNDLVIAAASLPVLAPEDLDFIRSGRGEIDGPRLIATWSTGLNDALALPNAYGPMRFIANEAGHIPFAPRDETEQELLRWAWKRGMGYVAFEDVMSAGRGYRLLFNFVTQHLAIAPHTSTVEALAAGAPEGPTISKAALDDADPAAIRALQLVGGIGGTFLASRAVACVATGGVYLVGSVSANEREMRFMVEQSPMLERFDEAGPMTDLANNVPIARVLHPEFGLLGAAEIARHLD